MTGCITFLLKDIETGPLPIVRKLFCANTFPAVVYAMVKLSFLGAAKAGNEK